MSDQDVDDKVPTTVKHDLVQLDTIFDGTNSGRDMLAKKLATAIEGITFATGDPKLLEAQMTLAQAYLATLKGTEDNAHRRAMSKLKQLETESASKHSAAVGTLLSQLTLGGSINIRSLGAAVPQTEEERAAAVEAAFNASDMGPIQESELKTDPNDLAL